MIVQILNIFIGGVFKVFVVFFTPVLIDLVFELLFIVVIDTNIKISSRNLEHVSLCGCGLIF